MELRLEGAPDADGADARADGADARAETVRADVVVSCCGFRPRDALWTELQVHQCYATAGPMKLAAALMASAGGGSGDCLAQARPAPPPARCARACAQRAAALSGGRGAGVARAGDAADARAGDAGARDEELRPQQCLSPQDRPAAGAPSPPPPSPAPPRAPPRAPPHARRAGAGAGRGDPPQRPGSGRARLTGAPA